LVFFITLESDFFSSLGDAFWDFCVSDGKLLLDACLERRKSLRSFSSFVSGRYG